MEVAQLNARIDAQVKRGGDETLARCGVSATEAIRALWSYLDRVGELPAFMQEQDDGIAEQMPEHTAAAEGAGMAMSLALERGLSGTVEDMSYEKLRDLAFEELVTEGVYRV
jgi:antitoxin component of RelBE/YafQ-DinJ toxin-antitoxin module